MAAPHITARSMALAAMASLPISLCVCVTSYIYIYSGRAAHCPACHVSERSSGGHVRCGEAWQSQGGVPGSVPLPSTLRYTLLHTRLSEKGAHGAPFTHYVGCQAGM